MTKPKLCVECSVRILFAIGAMAIFYRGAGVGTYWHTNDPRLVGFLPHHPGGGRNVADMVNHIKNGTTYSPFVSLTLSFGIARDYAFFGRAIPTNVSPAFVYEIEINNPPPVGLTLVDPVKEVVVLHSDPYAAIQYQHDGAQDFLLGLVSPSGFPATLSKHAACPPPGGGTPRAPNLTGPLETLVRALRDAEILAVGTIPAACVKNRYDIY